MQHSRPTKSCVSSLQKRVIIAHQYFGNSVVPTEINIEPHPVLEIPCIVIRQRYIKGTSLAKRPYMTALDAKQRLSLLNLLEKAKALYDKTGYLLDVNSHNLIVQNDEIFIIDTILMGAADVIMIPRTLKILNNELGYLKQKSI